VKWGTQLGRRIYIGLALRATAYGRSTSMFGGCLLAVQRSVYFYASGMQMRGVHREDLD